MATHATPVGRGAAEVAPGPPRLHPGRGRHILIALLGLLFAVALLVGVKGAQISALIGAGKRFEKMGPPPEEVSSAVAREQTWDETLDSVGSIASARGVSVSNDQPGIVRRIDFESGATARQGQVLVELDTRVERAQLASAQAREELAATTERRTRALVASGALPESQGDVDQAQLAAATADADALAAQIERKTVRAPYAGKLGIRLVNVGQYLPAGTPITTLESEEATYVDFALPQQDLALIGVGMPVRMALDTGDAGTPPPAAEGAVFAVDPVVDPSTRNIKVRATVPAKAKEEWLRPGMFVNVSVVRPKKQTVVAIPQTAVVHAPYGDSVFVVEDEKDDAGNPVLAPDDRSSKVVRQQFVRLGQPRGDFVAIADGIKTGDEVVVAGAFKLRNGMRIALNHEVELHPELAPHPVNR